jgi:alanine-alpha-ketoisovalerate/valine-pyruvate aminotransferase
MQVLVKQEMNIPPIGVRNLQARGGLLIPKRHFMQGVDSAMLPKNEKSVGRVNILRDTERLTLLCG